MTQAPTPGPLTAAIDMLSDARDFIDRFSDVIDGDYGTSEPNAAMVMVHEINATIEQLSAPTAPVEASGSVGLAASEIGAHIAKRDAEYEAALADLTIVPDASSLDEFGRSIFGALSDCPAMSIEKQADFVARALWPAVSALSTTPARAESQDEGAAGEPVGDGIPIGEGFLYRTTMTGERHIVHEATGFTIAKLPYDYRYTDNATQKALADKIVALYAHPSPTPAADDDRVLRDAVEALEPFAAFVKFERALIEKSPTFPLRPDDTVFVRWAGAFGSSAVVATYGHLRRAAEALAALKSTAAKEGGA